MKKCLKFLSFLVIAALPVSATFGYTSGEGSYFKQHDGSDGKSSTACYRDSYGNDEYWFCGKPPQMEKKKKMVDQCQSVQVGRNDDTNYYTHAHAFYFSKGDNQGIYWCCNGTSDTTGSFKKISYKSEVNSTWYDHEEVRTESVAGGTCTWTAKITVCGTVHNPRDKCTKPDNCPAGTKSIDGKCVKLCEDGYGFKKSGGVLSPNCIKCDTTTTQGLNGSECIQCEQNEFFDSNTLECVNKNKWIAIANLAYEKCWLCSSNVDLKKCLLDFTKRPLGATVPESCNIRTATEND